MPPTRVSPDHFVSEGEVERACLTFPTIDRGATNKANPSAIHSPAMAIRR